MERLTKRDEFGNADIIGVSCADLQFNLNFSEINSVTNALNKLADYEDAEETGTLVRLPCKVGDTVWELCKCVDGIYRIFPMTVEIVRPYGSVRWIKDEEPSVWNIYATHDYTKMYKNFYDFDRTVFLTREEAEKALKERERE